MFSIDAKSIETGIPERKRLRRIMSPHTKKGRRVGASRFNIPGTDRQITLDWDVVNAFEDLFYSKPDDVPPQKWGFFEPAIYFQLPRLRGTREFSVVDHAIVQTDHIDKHDFQRTAEKRIDPARVIDIKVAPAKLPDAIRAMISHIYEATNATTDFDWTLHPVIDTQNGNRAYWEEMSPGPGWIVIRRVSGINLDFAIQERAIPFQEGMNPWVFLEPGDLITQKAVFDHTGDEKPAEALSLPTKETMPLRLAAPAAQAIEPEVLRPLFKCSPDGTKRTEKAEAAVANLRVGQACELHLPNIKSVYNAIAQAKSRTEEGTQLKFKVTRFDDRPQTFVVTRRE